MKRTALILLTAIYLLSCVGIGVTRFYCCGKLASITLTYAASNDSGTNATKKNGCCRHESKNFKINDSHFTANTTVLNPSAPILLPAPACWTAPISLTKQTIRPGYRANAPPGTTDIPVYTLYCTYRI